jgi:ADP-heptose:LPS heptosyltransferase
MTTDEKLQALHLKAKRRERLYFFTLMCLHGNIHTQKITFLLCTPPVSYQDSPGNVCLLQSKVKEKYAYIYNALECLLLLLRDLTAKLALLSCSCNLFLKGG